MVLVAVTVVIGAPAGASGGHDDSVPPSGTRAAPAQDAPSDTGPDGLDPETPVDIEVLAIGPWLGPDDDLEVVVATTAVPADHVVRLRVGPVVDELDGSVDARIDSAALTPAAFVGDPVPVVDDAGARQDQVTVVLANRVTPAAGDEPDEPAPGTDPDSADEPATAALATGGVHPLAVEVLDPDGNVVAAQRTPLVVTGRGDEALVPLDIAVLVDLALPATLLPDGSRRTDGVADVLDAVDRTFTDDVTAPFTVLATGDTLDALAEVADGSTLDRLAGREAVALPQVRVELEALRRADLLGLLPDLVVRGARAAADVASPPSVAMWDPIGPLTGAAADLLADVDVPYLLLPGDALDEDGGDDREDDEGDETPDESVSAALVPPGPHPILGRDALRAVVTDDELSDALVSPLGTDVDAAATVLADLVLRPRVDDDVVLRVPAVPAGSGLAALADAADRPGAPIRFVGMDDVVRDPPSDRDLALGTALPADPDDSGDDLDAIAGPLLAATADVDLFATMVDEDSSRPDDLRLLLLGSVAAGLRTDERLAAIEVARDRVASTLAGLALVGQTDLNLTSRTGSLPVTVANANGFAVEVRLRVRSDRLAFPEGDDLLVRIGEDSERVNVVVEALATGSVPVFVELWTPDGSRLLASQQLNVRSTAVSGVGLALSVGALLVLVVWWFRTWRRNRDEDREVGDVPE